MVKYSKNIRSYECFIVSGIIFQQNIENKTYRLYNSKVRYTFIEK